MQDNWISTNRWKNQWHQQMEGGNYMANQDLMDKGKKVEKNDSNLQGTFTGVLFIGAFIALVWFSMFYVFISRQ